jgi:hypothetical protein
MFNFQRIGFRIPITLAALVSLVLGAGTAAATASHPAPPPHTCRPFTPFHANNFERSTDIDNRFLPLTPGTQFTLEGRANRGGQPLPHTVVFTVTDVVKLIDGVRTLTMWDRDINEGQLAEEELAFFAQDKAGNVWNLGEYPEEFDNGKFAGAPNTWISGQGALGGIHMPAHPHLDTPRYLQGFAPAIDFLDCAKILAEDQRVCVPVRCFNDALVTDETSPLADPNAHQRKVHAPGVGIVHIGAVNDPEGEALVLTKLAHLDASGLAAARRAVLRLDRRGFRNSDVYRQTQPALPR